MARILVRVYLMLGSGKRPQAPESADALADVVLQDSHGQDVRLGELWAKRPAVVVFLRHYG
jgi:hypothetical protein